MFFFQFPKAISHYTMHSSAQLRLSRFSLSFQIHRQIRKENHDLTISFLFFWHKLLKSQMIIKFVKTTSLLLLCALEAQPISSKSRAPVTPYAAET